MNNTSRIEAALTSIRHRWEYLDASNCPGTVIEALKTALPEIAPESWAKRLSWGGVFLNGRRISDDRELTVPCRVEYFEPKFDMERADLHFPEFSPDWIVYEDEDLIVAFKPDRLPSLPVREQTAFNMKNYLIKYAGKPVHLPSRLDTATSGLMTVSKSDRMHARLQRLFENRQVQKSYLFETPGRPGWSETRVEAAIARDRAHSVLRRVSEEGGKPATTHFQFLYQTPEGSSIILALPLSGRTHQIRVHAQSLGHPITGDNFYGGAPSTCLHLLSYRLQFVHPFTLENLDISVPERFIPGWLDSPGKGLLTASVSPHKG